jgi:hypothetical protein
VLRARGVVYTRATGRDLRVSADVLQHALRACWLA